MLLDFFPAKSMHDAREQRRGFCPTVWTPMESGDGLIVRVRTSSRVLSSSSVRALARIATTHGNGIIEITRRANLQLRGVSQTSLPALQDELVQEGLADASPNRERTLSLIVDPLAGLTSRAVELTELASQLEQRFSAPDLIPLLDAMPDKLAIALEAGGYALQDLSADIRVQRTRAQPHLAFFSLEDPAERGLLGAVHTSDVADAIVSLLEALSALFGERTLRMREATALYGHAPFREALRGRLIDAVPSSCADGLDQPLVGFHRGERPWFGLGVAFGAGDEAQWLAAASLAERFGDGFVRTTPRRTLILSGARADAHASLAREAEKAGFVVAPDDVLTRVIACSGAPACGSAFNETRPFAARLARALAPELAHGTLHVSGCAKSCASGRKASITVVHQPEGCKIGFDADVPTTMLGPTLSPREAYDTLSAFERGQRPPRRSELETQLPAARHEAAPREVTP